LLLPVKWQFIWGIKKATYGSLRFWLHMPLMSIKLLHTLTLQSSVVVTHFLVTAPHFKYLGMMKPELSLSTLGFEPEPCAHKSEHASDRLMPLPTELAGQTSSVWSVSCIFCIFCVSCKILILNKCPVFPVFLMFDKTVLSSHYCCHNVFLHSYNTDAIIVYSELSIALNHLSGSVSIPGVPVVLKFLKFQSCPEIVLKFLYYPEILVCLWKFPEIFPCCIAHDNNISSIIFLLFIMHLLLI